MTFTMLTAETSAARRGDAPLSVPALGSERRGISELQNLSGLQSEFQDKLSKTGTKTHTPPPPTTTTKS